MKLDRACAELERRAQARADSERAEYERKVAARERRTGSRKGRHIKPPTEAPEAKEQINLTDADSALMRKSRRHEYRRRTTRTRRWMPTAVSWCWGLG